MEDVEPDHDYLLYLRQRHPGYARIYFQPSGAHHPDYIFEGLIEEDEEEEEGEQDDRPSVGQGLQSDEQLARVVQDHGVTTSSQGDLNIINVQSSGNATEDGEMNEKEGTPVGEKLDWDEIDGLFCPICLEAWTSGGNHQVWSVHSIAAAFFLFLLLFFFFLSKRKRKISPIIHDHEEH